VVQPPPPTVAPELPTAIPPPVTATPDLPGKPNAKCPPQAKAAQCLAFLWFLLWMP
jgi:hypothetical protein